MAVLLLYIVAALDQEKGRAGLEDQEKGRAGLEGGRVDLEGGRVVSGPQEPVGKGDHCV